MANYSQELSQLDSPTISKFMLMKWAVYLIWGQFELFEIYASIDILHSETEALPQRRDLFFFSAMNLYLFFPS